MMHDEYEVPQNRLLRSEVRAGTRMEPDLARAANMPNLNSRHLVSKIVAAVIPFDTTYNEVCDIQAMVR